MRNAYLRPPILMLIHGKKGNGKNGNGIIIFCKVCRPNFVMLITHFGVYTLWCLLLIYVKKTYQFKIHCKDDVMISLH